MRVALSMLFQRFLTVLLGRVGLSKNGGKVELIHFIGQEGDCPEAGFCFCRASGECGIIAEAVIIHKVSERESVAKEQRFPGGGINRRLISGVQGMSPPIVR